MGLVGTNWALGFKQCSFHHAMQVLRGCAVCAFSAPPAFPPCYRPFCLSAPVRRLTSRISSSSYPDSSGIRFELLRRTARHERALEAVACRVEPVVPHPAPPQTRTCAMHASGSSRRAAATLVHSPGVLWAGLVRSRALPWRLPAAALPDGACPPVGRLGLT